MNRYFKEGHDIMVKNKQAKKKHGNTMVLLRTEILTKSKPDLFTFFLRFT